MESTTISGASGSSPRCATSMPARVRFNSTALMLEEPTSRPTIVFDPNPNMCPPLLSSSLGGRLRFLLVALAFHLVRLLFHPLIKLRFLEAPAIAQLERWNFLFAYVLVKRVRTHSQVLRSLANVHHFSRVGHNQFSLHRILPRRNRLPRPWPGDLGRKLPRSKSSASEFQCPEHISGGRGPRSAQNTGFYWVLCWFSGIQRASVLPRI